MNDWLPFWYPSLMLFSVIVFNITFAWLFGKINTLFLSEQQIELRVEIGWHNVLTVFIIFVEWISRENLVRVSCLFYHCWCLFGGHMPVVPHLICESLLCHLASVDAVWSSVWLENGTGHSGQWLLVWSCPRQSASGTSSCLLHLWSTSRLTVHNDTLFHKSFYRRLIANSIGMSLCTLRSYHDSYMLVVFSHSLACFNCWCDGVYSLLSSDGQPCLWFQQWTSVNVFLCQFIDILRQSRLKIKRWTALRMIHTRLAH